MKKKQLIAFASAMALAVTSLAGCGKSEESTQKEADGKNGSSPLFPREAVLHLPLLPAG